jgi:drug/metabolite transporter (DMT)-like permease
VVEEECAEQRVAPIARAVHVDEQRRRLHAYKLLALVLIVRPFGNLSLAWGMRHFSEILSANPLFYLRAMLNPYVALGILMLILAVLTRMALLSVADLSYVVPLTAFGYVLSTALGKFFLREDVTPQQWLGTLLIFAGTALVSTTSSARSNRSETAPVGG